MGEMSSEGANLGAGIDLSQFYQVFFEEAGENLDRMEQQLLEINIEQADDEELNSIFRCAHSVKGGAATFGFADVAELTHQMETLLDKLRRHELAPTAPMVDVLLEAGDALRAQLARHQGGGGAEIDTTELLFNIRAMAAGEKPPAPMHAGSALVRTSVLAQPVAEAPRRALPNVDPARHARSLELRVGPMENPADADNLVELFQEIVDLGTIETMSKPSAITRAARAEKAPAAIESSTLRVSVEIVDQLINLVGELVITQAMLAQNSKQIDPALFQQMVAGLADLDRNTRDLQESVMSIRMIPMSIVFNRFPRMLRDLAGKLGKKVDFVTHGEATELDKGLVEKITDPLTHLVRNSCDHGIEQPQERLAKGTPETGTITRSSSHQRGSISHALRDDGRGLSREKLLKKARERGIAAPDTMTDPEVWNLIFEPGFSTADVVTDVSGRGVGMDVVKKNITALGGTVDIDSAEGYGMRVSVRLPLTLAIMDGMPIGVGVEVYILPLRSVDESF